MLSAFSWLYSKIIDQRNSRYESGKFKTHLLSVPVISVGNITVGGTGKTPLVALVAEILAENGEKVCVISRGYKRKNPKQRVLVSDFNEIVADPNTAGDEPFELARKLLRKAIVIADANRVEAGRWAFEEYRITAVVLDDAFQHRKIARDLDIVAIDATNPFGNEKTLPAGILREPLENLKRADLFIITRSNLSKNIDKIEQRIREFNKDSPILLCESRTKEFFELESFGATIETPVEVSRAMPLIAFCALGNPDNFFDQMRLEGLAIARTKSFSDHHWYNQRDVDRLHDLASSESCRGFVTTSKDAVKLYQLNFRKPCYIANNELIIPQKKKLREMIDAVSKS